MGTRTLKTAAFWGIGALALAGAAGCFSNQEESVDGSGDEVTSATDTSAVLKSTLLLQAGCIATKIGPKHLLVAARCVAGNAALAKGKTLAFTVASAGGTSTAPDAGKDAQGVAPPPSDDAGDPTDPTDPASDDAGAPADAGGSTSRTTAKGAPTIADVQIHPSYTAKCKTADACGFGSVAAGDAPDIAVIILESELTTVPTLPVDLDAVGEADPLLVVSSGCSRVDANVKATSSPKTAKVVAVPADAVKHSGSAYEKSPQLVSHLGAGYVVTAGADWQPTAPRLCLGDIGAPVFRANAAVVAGVTSSFTTRSADKLVPVTIEHTRVDETSRFKIGTWLSDLGATTIHSCSESANGCTTRSYDGGLPDETGKSTTGDSTGGGDAGKPDVLAPDASDPSANGNVDQPLPDEGDGMEGEGSLGPSGGEDDPFADAAVPKKKKKTKSAGGCSTTGGGMPSTPDAGLVLGVGAALAVVARRRRR